MKNASKMPASIIPEITVPKKEGFLHSIPWFICFYQFLQWGRREGIVYFVLSGHICSVSLQNNEEPDTPMHFLFVYLYCGKIQWNSSVEQWSIKFVR